jgi:hypothetical protein
MLAWEASALPLGYTREKNLRRTLREYPAAVEDYSQPRRERQPAERGFTIVP